jgi:beta-aspartyl-peptidase (threonine type)
MLVGRPADVMARDLGLEQVANSYFTTTARRDHWKRILEQGQDAGRQETGTVGAIVLDSRGCLSAGGSTGGPTGKRSGRVGDTAILGAGLYADARVSVLWYVSRPAAYGPSTKCPLTLQHVDSSGTGDQIFDKLVASNVAKYHASGSSLGDAAQRVLRGVSATGAYCALIAMDANGDVVVESTARLFPVTVGSSSAAAVTRLWPNTVPVLTPHQFYNDGHLVVGLFHRPVTRGHALAAVQSGSDIFSLSGAEFVDVLNKVSKAASALTNYYNVKRCALVAEGGNSLAILPLHGLGDKWEPVTSNVTEFHEGFPGYVSSKDGPRMADDRLGVICAEIQAVSKISTPFNHRFDGDQGDGNLFARIVRGELPQWRVWEDDHHVAFLTPFANTPGFTVLVPRKHLSSDIFSIDEEPFSRLMIAAHRVAACLKQTFGTRRCGMIFEGFEIDYAHVKLIPIHHSAAAGDPVLTVAPFQETYQGYVTSLSGPLLDTECSASATALSGLYPQEAARPPRSWKSPSSHFSAVLREPWYKNLLVAQDALFHTSVDFFRKKLRYKYCFVPATTEAISSPMGLGSDSEPVPIPFLGQQTFLADSMQFALEYMLRICDEVPGVYYVNNSFRGEEPDEMHLNQFYHVECELLGPFSKGIETAEAYIIQLVSVFMEKHQELVKTMAGTTDHLVALVELYQSHGGKFPQISVNDALDLPMMDGDCWKYALASDPSRGRALTRHGELKLIEHFGGAVWLTEMDHLSVPFYQAFVDETRAKARCADLLLGPGEVLGLGERHVLAKDVRTALGLHEVAEDAYAWYVKMRESKPMLTTGWGMGTERFLLWVFGHGDVRDMTMIPRIKGLAFTP